MFFSLDLYVLLINQQAAAAVPVLEASEVS
jgi:hypothetical protein